MECHMTAVGNPGKGEPELIFIGRALLAMVHQQAARNNGG